MKKSLIILALAIGGITQAQCYKSCNRGDSESSVTGTFSGGLAQTLNLELALRINKIHAGFGVGVMVDNQIRTQEEIDYKRNDNAYYLNLGYQIDDKIFVGVRAGQHVIVKVTNIHNDIPNENKLLIGGLIGYQIAPRIRFNIGYDTFNKANLGVAFGL